MGYTTKPGRQDDFNDLWDGYQKLAYAMVISALELLKDVERMDNTNSINPRIYAIEYADAWAFVQSPYFAGCCAMCGMEGSVLLERIADHVDHDLVAKGEAYLYRGEKIEVPMTCLDGKKLELSEVLFKHLKAVDF